MSSKEELELAINNKGAEIRDLKAAKPPTLKEDLEPLVKELLALKVSYKDVTGEDFGGKPPAKKKEKGPAQQESKREGPSKKELNKMARAEAKAKAKAADAAKRAAEEGNNTSTAEKSTDIDAGDITKYNDLPRIESKTMTDKAFVQIQDLNESMNGQEVYIRGSIHTSRAVGKGSFIVLRQSTHTVQCVMFQSSTIPRAMVKYANDLSTESIVDIKAVITIPDTPVISCTQTGIELQVSEIHAMSKAAELPFSLEDAGRSEADAAASGMPTVQQDTSLNFRHMDLRTPANQAIFRIQSGVCMLFREFLLKKQFVEIHTPKLIGGSSEGGSNVFTLEYFGQPACLAQSPQLYKQIAAACSGFGRVFEVGPVFRAENSNTHRHLCEFTGLDFEMAINEHYYEALDLMSNLFTYIFDGISDRFKHELQIISQQYPFEPLQYHRPTLRLTYAEGITLLRQAGWEDASYEDDITTPQEKALGKIVKEKFGTDFYIMDKYPLGVRPFYTMPDPDNPKLSNSYDLFIRGEEIVSGAQRIHEVALLEERAKWWEIPLDSIRPYIDSFKHGALPHAGGGIGLERVVMLYLGLKNIRKTSMFPRDPNRLAP